jgi:hypothetical protein
MFDLIDLVLLSSRLLKEKGREQFWQKKLAICVVQGKTFKMRKMERDFHPF